MAKIIRFIGDPSIASQLIVSFKEGLVGRALIVDTTPRTRNLPIAFGVEDEVVYDIYDCLNNDMDLEKVMVKIDEEADLIASSYLEDKVSFGQAQLDSFLTKLAGYDYVLFQSNDVFDDMDFKNEDNIIIGQAQARDRSYYICDHQVPGRIARLGDLNPGQALENYMREEDYQPSLLERLKGLFA